MKTTLLALISLVLFSTGCSATWSGIKEDSSDAKDWTAKKIDESADYIKEKTE
ncbi:hypothetical protein [Sulfuricurvum sp.]|uniref:hypothetical protein n=1 Tax=Sulfuricurvum sp. TaxID=2025608 RepID=UPI003BAE515C